jgi:lysophospholipase L1-like esterase
MSNRLLSGPDPAKREIKGLLRVIQKLFFYLMITGSIVLFISFIETVTPVKALGQTRILMIGDSITEGVQSNPSAEPYPTVTASVLGKGFTVTQIGCGGATTWDWSSLGGRTLCGGRFWDRNVYEARALPNLPADIVTVMLGTNDATGVFEPAPISPDEYRDNLANLVTNLLTDGAGQIMLIPPPPMCESTRADVVKRLEAYRTIVGHMCRTREGVVCGPDVYTLLNQDDFHGCDVHPNGLGHKTIGIAIASKILGQESAEE